MNQAGLEILPDPQALADRVAAWLLSAAQAKGGRIAVALSGGSTPRRLHETLASPAFREVFPWARTHWFWGDERFVPQHDPLSNYRMVREAMLARAPIPAANIHAIPTEGLTPEAAASAYERELKAFYGADRIDPARPLFDVTLLGLGSDGHIASLFPGDAALDERRHWVVAVIGATSEARITLTYPALENSAAIAFLVEGRGKRDVFRRLRRGDPVLPATQLRPNGELWLFADTAAAGESVA